MDLITSKLSSTMTHDEALAYRLELIEERTQYLVNSNAVWAQTHTACESME